MRQVARSPKRSSHEDSDVQRDVNMRVHEGAIDSVAMRMIMFKKESGMDFGMQRPVEANSLQFSQIRIPCPHRRKDMMPTLFAGLCQMSKMSRVQRVLERVQVRFGICWLLVRCRGNVSPDAFPRVGWH